MRVSVSARPGVTVARKIRTGQWETRCSAEHGKAWPLESRTWLEGHNECVGHGPGGPDDEAFFAISARAGFCGEVVGEVTWYGSFDCSTGAKRQIKTYVSDIYMVDTTAAEKRKSGEGSFSDRKYSQQPRTAPDIP